MEDRWGWAAAAAALLAPAGAALANWWNRKGAKEQREGDWREKGQQALFTQQGTQLAAAYKRVAELETELARVEADRDQGWGRARAWFDRAHDERHKHSNSLQAVLSHLRRSGDVNGFAAKIEERKPPDLPQFNDLPPRGAP